MAINPLASAATTASIEYKSACTSVSDIRWLFVFHAVEGYHQSSRGQAIPLFEFIVFSAPVVEVVARPEHVRISDGEVVHAEVNPENRSVLGRQRRCGEPP